MILIILTHPKLEEIGRSGRHLLLTSQVVKMDTRGENLIYFWIRNLLRKKVVNYSVRWFIRSLTSWFHVTFTTLHWSMDWNIRVLEWSNAEILNTIKLKWWHLNTISSFSLSLRCKTMKWLGRKGNQHKTSIEWRNWS